MKVLNKVLILLTFFFFISCKKEDSKIDKSDAIRFRYFNLENAGWKSRQNSQKVENIIYTATEVPIQYYLLKDIGKEDLNNVDSVYEENKRERIIEFTFQDENEDDLLKEKYTKIDYESSVKYMSFFIDKDYYVVTSKNDTIKCSGVTFERSFKIAPYNKVLLFFSDIDPNEKIQLVYQDNLFKNGILKFRFKEPILNL